MGWRPLEAQGQVKATRHGAAVVAQTGPAGFSVSDRQHQLQNRQAVIARLEPCRIGVALFVVGAVEDMEDLGAL